MHIDRDPARKKRLNFLHHCDISFHYVRISPGTRAFVNNRMERIVRREFNESRLDTEREWPTVFTHKHSARYHIY